MNKIKFLLKCLLVVAFVFLFDFLFRLDINSYTRVMMSELYDDGYIDALFLGASHTYRSFDTALIEEKTGLNAFNAGSSAQQVQGSYYLLKEAHEQNGVGRVFLDITYTMMAYEEPGKKETYIIADYIRSPGTKFAYLWDAFGTEGIINGILPSLHGSNCMPSTAKEHLTQNYKKDPYPYVTYSNEAYVGQGFVYSYEVVADDFIFREEDPIDPDTPISSFAMQYLRQIIEYCRKNKIELVLVNPPMPDETLVTAEHFQAYVETIQQIASEEEIEYWDFNLAKEDVLTLERTDFWDASHLNGAGAEKFSQCFSELLNGTYPDPFYTRFDEKPLNLF